MCRLPARERGWSSSRRSRTQLRRRSREIADSDAELTTTVAALAATQTERRQALDAVQAEVTRLKDAHARLDAQLAAGGSGPEDGPRSSAEAEAAATIVTDSQAGSTAFLARRRSRKPWTVRFARRQDLCATATRRIDKTLALAKAELKTTATALEEILVAENRVAALQPEVNQQATLEAQRSQIEKQISASRPQTRSWRGVPRKCSVRRSDRRT